MERKKYILIACAVLKKECEKCLPEAPHDIDLKVIEQGLHDVGEEKMSASLQEHIDSIDQSNYDAILMAYGLCNNGIRNLTSSIPLVIPRAHDCITLLLGSKEKYNEYFNHRPGTFFLSVGWVEEAGDSIDNPMSTTRELGMSSYEEYVEKYGEENAKYLAETLNDHLKNYSRIAYIDTQVENTAECEDQAKAWADERSWSYEHIEGSTRLLSGLMSGEWNSEEYLVINPGQTLEPSHDDKVIKAIDT